MNDDTAGGDEPVAGVAGRMADAVSYLSTVAREAGLSSISADLLLICEKLKQKARPTGSSTGRKTARGG